MPKVATDRERAIIYALVAGYIQSWKHAYILAAQKTEDEVKAETGVNVSASRWKQHPEIIKTYTEIRAFYEAQEEEKRQRWRSEEGKKEEGGKAAEGIECTKEEAKPKAAKFVDYSNPDNQRRKLNELVNAASDPGEALDALKVIIQGQRADREAAREQKTVRAYLPLTCSECPLMEKARKKSGKG